MEQERDSSTLILYVIAALLLVVGGAWLLLSLRDVPEPPATPPPAPAALEIPDQIDPQFELQQNLDMGEMALSAGQLVQPPDGSALYFFLSALTQDPDNPRARDGLARISSLVAARAQEQFAGEQFAGLGDSIRVLQRIDAASPALLELQRQLDEAVAIKFALAADAMARGQLEIAQVLLDQLATMPGVDTQLLAQRQQELTAALETAATDAVVLSADASAAAAAADSSAVATPAATTTAPSSSPESAQGDDEQDAPGDDVDAQLAAQAAERLASGQLLEPAGDSAAFFLRELQRVAPDDPALAQGLEALVVALAQRAEGFAVEGSFEEAEAILEAASSFGVAQERVALAADELTTRRIERESQRLVPAGEMVNTRVVRPRYPRRALRDNAEGYVLLNFTVLTDGTTDRIEVVESSGAFDRDFRRAAEAAVAQWEFEPREFLGQVIEQRVQARVSFEINQ